MRYKAWLVDLDGTLYHASGVRLAMGLELALGHWRNVPTLRAFRQEHEWVRREAIEEVESPFTLQIERTAKRLGRNPADIDRVVTDWMIHRPGKWLRLFRRRTLLAEIARFRAQGGRTALVSDYPAARKLAAIGAADLFDVVVASGEPGGPRRLKPWPDGYLLAAQQLGFSPGQCVILGDRTDADGEAARRAGIDFRKIGGLR